MAGSFPNGMETSILDFVFGGVGLTISGTRELALYQADPGETVTSGTAGEPSGAAYARASITFGSASIVGTTGTISNTNDITFPQATANYLTGNSIDGWAVFANTAPSNTGLMHGDFLVAKPVLSGDTAKVLTGNLTFTLV